MKKVIRLTESDLNKIVKKVLKEQSLDTPQLPKELEECMKQHLQVTDVLKYPACVSAGIQVMSGGIPDEKTLTSCATQLNKNREDATAKFLAIASCFIKKKMTNLPIPKFPFPEN